MWRRPFLAYVALLAIAAPVAAQERPFRTADPEAIGHRRLAIESGAEWHHAVEYPLSGLTGDLLRAPTLTFRLGLGGIAEFQVASGYDILFIDERRDAPFADVVDVDREWTSDIFDPVVAMKIRLQRETRVWPATGLRVSTRIPSAGNESGLGTDAMDFHYWILAAKSLGGVRIAGNVGLGVLSNPRDGDRQNDVLLYGLAITRPVGSWTVGAELFGRVDTEGIPAPGTEDTGQARIGGRWARGAIAIDGALFVGLDVTDADFGGALGVTWLRDDVLSGRPGR